MKNLEQIRAQAALNATADNKFKRSDIAGFPALIIQNGLLAAFAYASEINDKGRVMRPELMDACNKASGHLANEKIGLPVLENVETSKELIARLSSENVDAIDLQRTTSEALAFFAYLKRFAATESRE